jgi:hypothetical protein
MLQDFAKARGLQRQVQKAMEYLQQLSIDIKL